ncbi:MAG: M28 family peptidase [Actinobacteria bacterium]|nr:M28 family peptidase [Actinomycetota bacterium]
MRFRHGAAFLLILVVLLSCSAPVTSPEVAPGPETPSPAVSPSPSPVPPPLEFNAARAMEHTHHLSVDIGKRTAGSPGEEAAVAYIEEVFRAAKLHVTRQSFQRADGGASYNIIGRIAGADYSAGYLLIGGHHDTVEGSPGGNDNASGTAVVMTLAELFGMQAAEFDSRKVAIEFVAFGAEEVNPSSGKHHEGSLAYAAGMSDPPLVQAMLSVDMVGNGPDLKLVGWRERASPIPQEMAAIAAEIGVPHEVLIRGDISDHTSFLRKGVPSAFLWSGNHPTIHTASDTFEVVEIESVERTGRLTLEWLRRRTGL